MDSPIIISLIVSAIGMLALFLALALLCGMMYLMTALIQDRLDIEEAEGRQQRTRGERQKTTSRKRQVAVIAVALARTEQELASLSHIPPVGGEERRGEAGSAWWALYHQRKLTLDVPPRRSR
ncbi:MAG: OadG family transporter subunit [Chloroflexota bacterium]|nr:OadG family transporter subunit [Chloroflexota bacterium]